MPSLGGRGSYGGDDPSGGASRDNGGYGMGGSRSSGDNDAQKQAYQEMARSLAEAGYGNLSTATSPAAMAMESRYRDYADRSIGDRLGALIGRKELAPSFSQTNLSPNAETSWDVAGSPLARGAAYALGGPLLGGAYNAAIGIRDGKFGSAALSGLSGLAGAAAPLSMGSALLGSANQINGMSEMMGGKTIDDVMSGNVSPVQQQGPNQQMTPAGPAVLNQGTQGDSGQPQPAQQAPQPQTPMTQQQRDELARLLTQPGYTVANRGVVYTG
ncbi:hypothetical protein [Thalassospira marina]|uniref:Uncharacterized protein n=1 Tax=Thalassospira marina TaxID=2048283 RepID=A0A2N3KXW0_9PROT|nr:hypothetical protein [Thalassospira marina]PKR55415.1 hypothetical protein COO20_04390 [Thalassospira marina]